MLKDSKGNKPETLVIWDTHGIKPSDHHLTIDIFLPFQFQKTKLYLTKQTVFKYAFGMRPNSHKSVILTT